MRVLLAEDHKPPPTALGRRLERENFTVDVAGNGVAADAKGRATPYDVIILDLALPGKDGLTVLEGWRRDGLTTHVLTLTSGGAAERVRSLDRGADDSLSRPFEPEELLARLRALI